MSQLVNQFKQMQKMLKRMGGMGTKRIKKKKGRGAKQGRTGGRVTAKKSQGKQKLVLPGLEDFEKNEDVAALLKDFS